MNVEGKRVLVVGLGKSGEAAVRSFFTIEALLSPRSMKGRWINLESRRKR